MAQDYPKTVEHKRMAAATRLEAPSSQVETQTFDLGFQGVWLKTEDERTVAQFRVDGFTLNRLKPYTRWEQILPEALRLWRLYVELARPQSVTRVALRYVNHMSLPGPVAQLNNYIETTPRLPRSVPQVLSSFATRTVLEDPERRMMANVMQVVEVGVDTPAPSLLLDIDVYRTGDFDVDEVEIEAMLGELRLYKNEIFFGSVTERFVEVFE